MDTKLVPLYKKADNLIMKNYRSVSILPSMSKVLEKVTAIPGEHARSQDGGLS